MIDPKELRIGNYIHTLVSGIPVWSVVCCISENEVKSRIINLSKVEVFPKEQLKPIELTEEWLFKLGFVDGKIDNENYCFKVFFHDCWHIYYNEKHDYGASNCNLEGYYNVNDVQNIFYALTGEELTLKQ